MKPTIYAAVRTKEQLERALMSNVDAVFHLQPNIKTLPETVKKVRSARKKLFLHIDLAEGIGKDKFGVEYVGELGVDGIISTRAAMIRAAKERHLFTVQRFFIVDSQAVETAIETVRNTKPDMIELMPGVIGKTIRLIREQTHVSIIAGGLIETTAEAEEAIRSGAIAVSTGSSALWFL